MDFRVNSHKPHNPKQHHWSLCLLVKQNKSFRMTGNTTSLALKWTKWSILLNSDACPRKLRGAVWIQPFPWKWKTWVGNKDDFACAWERDPSWEGMILQCIVLRFSEAINIPSCRNASSQWRKKWTQNIEMPCVHCLPYWKASWQKILVAIFTPSCMHTYTTYCKNIGIPIWYSQVNVQ